MIAADYAKALHELGTSDVPGTSGVPLLRNLRGVLKRRGHEKLLPRIFSEYKKLLLQKERLTMHKQTTPEQGQTRILLELYKRLVASG